MNTTERRMLDTLLRLRDDYGAKAVKAEFEAEGSRTEELIMLNEVVFRADMNLVIKIGGCEAIRDMYECRLLGAAGIMAPMIETPFAMEKFIKSINKVFDDEEKARIEFVINAETKTCLQNYDEILAVPGCGAVSSVVVGRSDLSASLGIPKKDINCDRMLSATLEFLEKSRAHGMIASMGGGLSIPDKDTKRFIDNLSGHIDRFETRKIIFDAKDGTKDLKGGLKRSMQFEIDYLKNKCEYYSRLSENDMSRLKSMEHVYSEFE